VLVENLVGVPHCVTCEKAAAQIPLSVKLAKEIGAIDRQTDGVAVD
jgi:hypothetical protein